MCIKGAEGRGIDEVPPRDVEASEACPNRMIKTFMVEARRWYGGEGGRFGAEDVPELRRRADRAREAA